MVIDSSAILAILQREPEAAVMAQAIRETAERCMSAISVLEIGTVIVNRRGEGGTSDLDSFIACTGIRIMPFDAEQAALACQAFERYGKGRHPARLNLGDCATYALASSRAEPLLFKGSDFSLTDIEPAVR